MMPAWQRTARAPSQVTAISSLLLGRGVSYAPDVCDVAALALTRKEPSRATLRMSQPGTSTYLWMARTTGSRRG